MSSNLKFNLLLSLIILNLGLIFSVLIIENDDFIRSSFYKIKIGAVIGIMIVGIIYFIYSLNKILLNRKNNFNSESSNPLNS